MFAHLADTMKIGIREFLLEEDQIPDDRPTEDLPGPDTNEVKPEVKAEPMQVGRWVTFPIAARTYRDCTYISKKMSGIFRHWNFIRGEDRSVPVLAVREVLRKQDNRRFFCWQRVVDFLHGGCERKPRFEFFMVPTG